VKAGCLIRHHVVPRRHHVVPLKGFEPGR
jgi:hypothetical protein